MSFLKDFKEELSQDVNELVNMDDNQETDTTSKKSKEDEKMARGKKQKEVVEEKNIENTNTNENTNVEEKQKEDEKVNTLDEKDIESNIDMVVLNELFGTDENDISIEEKSEEAVEDIQNNENYEKLIDDDINLDNIDISDYLDGESETEEESVKADGTLLKDLARNIKSTINDKKLEEMMEDDKESAKAELRGSRTDTSNEYSKEEASLATEEVAEVTKGTMIDGNIVSEGSMNIYGKIKGNVACRGKLVVCGIIVGSSRGAEIFTNNARIDGDVTSDGSLKIGNGSVIIGNIYGSSAVIAGAVQGDVDIHGPVIIDGTAVIQGNIRSRSVQVNNGAAIEGMISQCYAEVDYAALFDKTFSK